jgi:hypothetical protein
MDPTTVAQALAAYAQPARPVTPTPTSQDDIMDALYGPGTQTPPAPLPDWVPPNVQNYINTRPSYAEGERQGWPSNIAGGEPYSPTPQIDDIRRLFQGRITRNAPTGDDRSVRAGQLRALMKLPGFSGFTGGDEI